jgi:hypothetical protein
MYLLCENCALLSCYAACNGNSLPTFRDDLLVPSSRVKISWMIIIIIIIIILLLLLLLLKFLNAIKLSLGGSSPYTSKDKTNNKFT